MAGQVAQEYILRFMADCSGAIAEFKKLQGAAQKTADTIVAETEKALQDMANTAKLTGDKTGGLAEQVNVLKRALGTMASAGYTNTDAAKAMASQYKTMADQLKRANNPLTQFASSSKLLTNIVSKIPAPIMNVASAVGQMVPGLGAAAAAFGPMGLAALAAGKLIIGMFTAVKQSITEGVAFNKDIENATMAFTVMLKDVGKANALISQLKTVSVNTPIGLAEGADSAKQLMAYGFAQSEIISNLKIMKTLAVATNTSLSDITYVYGTLRSQGQAYTRDLMQFAMRGIPIYENLAHVMGVSVKQIRTLTEQGKIGFTEVEKALKRMTGAGGQFDGLLEQSTKTLTGKANVYKNLELQLKGMDAQFFSEMQKHLYDLGIGWDKMMLKMRSYFDTLGKKSGAKIAQVDYGTDTFTSEQQAQGNAMILNSSARALRAPLTHELALAYETLSKRVQTYAETTHLSWEDAARVIAQKGSFTQEELNKLLSFKDKFKTFWEDWQNNVSTAASDVPLVFRNAQEVLDRSLGAMSGSIDGKYKQNVEDMVGIWDDAKKELKTGTGEFGKFFMGDAELEEKKKWLQSYADQIQSSISAEIPYEKAATGAEKERIDTVMEGWKEELYRIQMMIDALKIKEPKSTRDKFDSGLNIDFTPYMKFRVTLEDIRSKELPYVREELSRISGMTLAPNATPLERTLQMLTADYQKQYEDMKLKAEKLAFSRNTYNKDNSVAVAGALTEEEQKQLDLYADTLLIQLAQAKLDAKRTESLAQYNAMLSGTGKLAENAQIKFAEAFADPYVNKSADYIQRIKDTSSGMSEELLNFTADFIGKFRAAADYVGLRISQFGKGFAAAFTSAIANTDMGRYADYKKKATESGTDSSLGAFMTGTFASLLAQGIASIENVSAVLNYIQTIISAMINVIKPALNAALKPLVDLLKIVGSALGVILLPVIDFIGKIIRLLYDAVISILGALGLNTDYLASIASDLSDTILKSLQNLYEVGALSGPEYEARIAALNSDSTASVTAAFDPNSTLGQFMSMLSEVLNDVYNFIKALFEACKPFFALIGDILNDVLGLLSPILDACTSVIGAVLTALKPIIIALGPAIASIVEALKPLLKTIADIFSSPAFTALMQFVGNTLAALITNYITPWIVWQINVVEGVVSTINGVLNFLYGVLTGNAQAKALGWALIHNGLLTVANALIHGLNNILAAITTAIYYISLQTVSLHWSIPDASFAVGTPSIPYDMTAQLHKGEGVIPATFMDSIRSGELALSGGSSTTNSNDMTIYINVEGSVSTENDLVDAVYNGIKTRTRQGRLA